MDSILRCYLELGGFLVISLAGLMLTIVNKPKGLLRWIESHAKLVIILAVAGAAVAKFAGVIAYFGAELFVKDFNVFLMWSNLMTDDGLRGFMVEYPAGSLYLLAGLRGLQKLVGLGQNFIVSSLLLKSPGIIADLILAGFLYRIALKYMAKVKAMGIFIFLLFIPTQLINSSFWGQIDGVLILLIVLSMVYLYRADNWKAIIFYTLACLTKAQAIFFAPVFGMYFIMPLLKKEIPIKSKAFVRQYVIPILSCVAVFTLMTLPFKESLTDIWLIDYFKHISTEHPHNTMGAVNLFGLHGGNGASDTAPFLLMTYKTWGYIFIAGICGACAVLSFHKRRENIYLLAAFCMISIFTLGISMHERYILPAIAFLLLAYIMDGDWRKLVMTFLYTLLGSINQLMIIFDLFGGRATTFRLMSGIAVALYGIFLWVMISTYRRKDLLVADR